MAQKADKMAKKAKIKVKKPQSAPKKIFKIISDNILHIYCRNSQKTQKKWPKKRTEWPKKRK
jgi:hypothetical protein